MITCYYYYYYFTCYIVIIIIIIIIIICHYLSPIMSMLSKLHSSNQIHAILREQSRCIFFRGLESEAAF